ncbi:MAG: glutamine-hydrolyzing GMP synthase [Bifidobacteriaceae bacterium]|nr:glutamine-hydrolyzing GMP synthase [Bifidobacteriaceae bacterium]
MNHNPVVVIDFGAQYAQLITRRVREAGIYSMLLPYTSPLDEILALRPQAIILTGGPSNVTKTNAPKIPDGLLDCDLPILAICYGFQAIADNFAAKIGLAKTGEYGLVEMTLNKDGLSNPLFNNLPVKSQVWMSHEVEVKQIPLGFVNLASTPHTQFAAFGNFVKNIYGVQWHPEVIHTEFGQKIMENFLYKIAKITPNWTTDYIIEEQISAIKKQVGHNKVICGFSGGVDSAVAAALVNKAIGQNLSCVFINHGLLRLDEAEQVVADFKQFTGANLIVIDDSKVFLKKLQGVTDPETKRKIIGEQFIRSFENFVANLAQPYKFLVQGTLYPDVVESGGGSGTDNIKSHHNVAGLPDDMQFALVEPLKDLFKDEVRLIGKALGLPDRIVNRQPFPGPGLAVRIIGEVTSDNLNILRTADAIVRQELKSFAKDIWQCPVILLTQSKTVGVKGDQRHYGWPVVIRPVSSQDAMTADWFALPEQVLTRISNRITNEVNQISRVVLDITQKPPGTIEWE